MSANSKMVRYISVAQISGFSLSVRVAEVEDLHHGGLAVGEEHLTGVSGH